MKRTHIQVTIDDCEVRTFPSLEAASVELNLSKWCLYRKDILKGFTFIPVRKNPGRKYHFIKHRIEKIKI